MIKVPLLFREWKESERPIVLFTAFSWMHMKRCCIKDARTYMGIIPSRYSTYFGGWYSCLQPIFFPFPANSTKIFFVGRLAQLHRIRENHHPARGSEVSWPLQPVILPHLLFCDSGGNSVGTWRRGPKRWNPRASRISLFDFVPWWECEAWNLAAFFSPQEGNLELLRQLTLRKAE